MTIISKSSVKATFETNDKPTQAEFEDLIDTAIPDWQISITTLVQSGNTGILEVQSSTQATTRAIGVLGVQLLAVATTASAQGHIGLVPSALGLEIFEAATTASIQGHIGGGSVGIQLLTAETTASATNIVGGSIAASAATKTEMEAASTSAKYASPQNLINHPAIPKIVLRFNGSAQASIRSSFGVSAVSRLGAGQYRVDFTVAFSNTSYVMSGSLGGANPGVNDVLVMTSAAAITVSSCVVDAPVGDRPNVSVIIWGDQ